MSSHQARRPDLFIIGAAKCGTTSMYEYLSGHPQVFMSPRKEPRFFSPDLIGERDSKRLRHPQDLDRYLSLFAAAAGELRVGEASVQYVYSRQAPHLIHEFDPDAHLIVMLRNPIDMMHSLHTHFVAAGNEPIADFETALAAQEERRRGVRLEGPNSRLMVYADRARFGEQLARWYDVFDRDRIHVTILEDMKRDPAAEFRRVLEFLQVEPDYLPESFATHNMPRSTLLRSVMRSQLPRRVRRELLPALFGEAGALHVAGRFRRLMVRQVNRRRVERPPLDQALRLQLQQELADDVTLLSRLLGRNMAALWWSQRDHGASDGVAHRSANHDARGAEELQA